MAQSSASGKRRVVCPRRAWCPPGLTPGCPPVQPVRRRTVAAWCELRNDFRNFRLDRIVDLTPTAETFEDEPCRRLRDYLRQIGDFAERILDD